MSDKNIERKAKFNLVWRKNSTYRNAFYSLIALVTLLFGEHPGRGLLNTNPKIAKPLLYAILPLSVVVYWFMNGLYKTTVSELTVSEIEIEKNQIIAEGTDKKERRVFIIVLVVFLPVFTYFLYLLISILRLSPYCTKLFLC